jgi:putative nucleotidyltransferase with HDIG domain
METTGLENKVRQVVSNIRNLPTPPIVFHQIQKVINDQKASAAQIASVLQEDPAMSVKVLKLTNSAFYGLAREIDSVKQAVVVVGIEAIKNLVLSASVIDMFKGKQLDEEYQEHFWRHSLATAFCGRLMARSFKASGMADPDAAFSAGLLHDIGKMVISCFLPDEFKQFKQAREQQPGTPDHVIEREVLGYDHAQIGGFLAVQWKLPPKLGDAIAHHHNPEQSIGGNMLAHIIHLADAVSRRTFTNSNFEGGIIEFSPEALTFLNITDEEVAEYDDKLRAEYVKAETFMAMAGIASGISSDE